MKITTAVGDTLSSISDKYLNGDFVSEIISLNKHVSDDDLRAFILPAGIILELPESPNTANSDTPNSNSPVWAGR